MQKQREITLSGNRKEERKYEEEYNKNTQSLKRITSTSYLQNIPHNEVNFMSENVSFTFSDYPVWSIEWAIKCFDSFSYSTCSCGKWTYKMAHLTDKLSPIIISRRKGLNDCLINETKPIKDSLLRLLIVRWTGRLSITSECTTKSYKWEERKVK